MLAGKLPLLVAVDRASDIQALLDLAREYRLRVIVQGGAEAWRVAPALAAAKVPVLVSALDNIPASFDALGARQENAALLRRAGVPVVITAGAVESFNVRNVKQHAGNAVAYGLPWDEALRAVTLAPAEVFGVADTVGSLAVGKAANVVVWSGDPFEFSTRVEHVFVRGVERVERSRQDLLSERYKTPGTLTITVDRRARPRNRRHISGTAARACRITSTMWLKSAPPLGDFEQLVLMGVLRLGDAAYGAAIRQEIHARSGP